MLIWLYIAFLATATQPQTYLNIPPQHMQENLPQPHSPPTAPPMMLANLQGPNLLALLPLSSLTGSQANEAACLQTLSAKSSCCTSDPQQATNQNEDVASNSMPTAAFEYPQRWMFEGATRTATSFRQQHMEQQSELRACSHIPGESYNTQVGRIWESLQSCN